MEARGTVKRIGGGAMRAQARAAGVLAAGWLCGAGCEVEREAPATPDTQPPAIAIVSPTPGAIVVDSVAVTATASDPGGVARVTLLVDGAALATRYLPPWILPWDTSVCRDSTHHVLQVEAVDPAGNLAVSDSVAVRVLLNQAPRIVVVWPPDRLWVAADRADRAWRCLAWDPEDGPLPADAVTWRLDGAPLCAGCLGLAAPPIQPGERRLTVTAHDRWGRRSSRTQRLTAFADPGRASPESTWACFVYALRARNPAEAAACLSESFALHAPEGRPALAALTAADAARALAAVVSDTLLEIFALECHPGPFEVFEERGHRHAKVDLRDLSVTVVYAAGADAAPGFTIRGSAARVYLRAGQDASAPGTEAWSLDAWWDLHGSTWAAWSGPSLTRLLLEKLARGSSPPPGT